MSDDAQILCIEFLLHFVELESDIIKIVVLVTKINCENYKLLTSS